MGGVRAALGRRTDPVGELGIAIRVLRQVVEEEAGQGRRGCVTTSLGRISTSV